MKLPYQHFPPTSTVAFFKEKRQNQIDNSFRYRSVCLLIHCPPPPPLSQHRPSFFFSFSRLIAFHSFPQLKRLKGHLKLN